MGLSVMQDAPDMDQALRYANAYGQFGYIEPSAWTGEQNLNGLGLGDGSNVPDTINAVGAAATNVIGAIAQLKSNKRGRVAPARPAAQPPAPIVSAAPSGSNDMSKWLIYGGIALAGVVILMVVMKKKKKSGGD